MIVSADRIKKHYSTVVDPAPPQDFIEGSSINIHVKKIFRPRPFVSFMGKNKRCTLQLEPHPVFQGRPYFLQSELSEDDINSLSEIWFLEPGSYYIVQTEEKFIFPENLRGDLRSRVSSFLSGLVISSAVVAPGFEGECMFTVFVPTNLSGCVVERGAALLALHLQEFEPGAETDAYAGIWGGGKIQTDGAERAQ